MPQTNEQLTATDVTIVPANESSWDDIRAIFGTRGDPAGCQCQWFKIPNAQWRYVPKEEKRQRLHDQTGCDDPHARTTSGLVAYLNREPVGWVAVEPRTVYVRLMRMRAPWLNRAEDKTDNGVWSVTCFVPRVGFRKRGISRALARATVDFARDHGAASLEGYPMITEPGQNITWGELYVGSRRIFEDAGFSEVSHPSPRRVVMRIDF